MIAIVQFACLCHLRIFRLLGVQSSDQIVLEFQRIEKYLMMQCPPGASVNPDLANFNINQHTLIAVMAFCGCPDVVRKL